MWASIAPRRTETIEIKMDGTVDATVAALPPPQSSPKAAVKPAATGAVVIALPEAAAEQTARHERTAWEMANQAGFAADQSAALEPHADDADTLRTLSMRFAPEKRDG